MHGGRQWMTAVVTAMVAAAALPAAAQQSRIRTINLDHGASEFAESFSGVAGAVELPDGRLVVLDNQEKELRLVDLTHGTMQPISRTGGGPLEYQTPGVLLAGASDTVAYYDALQRRVLLISPRGAPVRVVSLGTGDALAMLSGMQPSAVDASGRIYGQTLGMSVTGTGGSTPAPGMSFADSVEIQSLDPATGHVDTLTRIRSMMAQTSPKISMSSDGVSLSITAPNFSSRKKITP